jgi:hypothetical protein
MRYQQTKREVGRWLPEKATRMIVGAAPRTLQGTRLQAMADVETPMSFKKRQPSGVLNRASPGKLLNLPSPFDSQSSTPDARKASSSSFLRRWSAASSHRKSTGDPFSDDPAGKESKIPSLLPEYNPPVDSTPLPKIAITVLCLCMLGEFLSAATVRLLPPHCPEG